VAGRRGRREVHPALPVRAERVVLGALLRIAQNLVGLVDLLEPLGRGGAVGRGLQVGMVLPRELRYARLISSAVAVRGTPSTS
jgi:hypothetical protein